MRWSGQEGLIDVTTRGILPLFASEGKSFVLLFWSRDPDGTQHNHGDSLGKTSPGINGPSVRLGVENADRARWIVNVTSDLPYEFFE